MSNKKYENAMILFVTLPVKPEKMNAYLALTLNEIKGARNEEGNSAFFAYTDEKNVNTLYLFEHWNSEDWLVNTHAKKDYYIKMRAVESEVLQSEVSEVFLNQIEPIMSVPAKTNPVGYAKLSIVTDPNADFSQQFAKDASKIRNAEGNLGVWLLSNVKQNNGYYFIEHWQNEQSRTDAIQNNEMTFYNHLSNAETVVLKDVLANEQ